MEQIIGYSKCQCGAITLYFENGASNSMYQDTFDSLGIDLTGVEKYTDTYYCDHCVNHWGIDLCECGSGMRVGECDCGSNKAHDELGVKFDSIGAIIKGFRL